MSYPFMVESLKDVPRGLRQRGSLQSMDADTPIVAIYCREDSHADTPWFVDAYRRGENGWLAMGYYPTRNGFLFPVGRRNVQYLVGDQPVANDGISSMDPEFRMRFALECGFCGLRVARRSTRAYLALEKLWAVGLCEISIRGIAAIL